jgi:subtilisin family serine protease
MSWRPWAWFLSFLRWLGYLLASLWYLLCSYRRPKQPQNVVVDRRRKILYRPGEVIVAEADFARPEVRRVLGRYSEAVREVVEGLVLVRGIANPRKVVAALRELEATAQLNHVFVAGAKMKAKPRKVWAAPNYLGGGTFAAPAPPPHLPWVADAPLTGREVTVAVLDTGIRDEPFPLESLTLIVTSDGPKGGKSGGADGDVDLIHRNDKGEIEPANGHGTFVSGLVHRRAPYASVQIDKVLDKYGIGDDFAIAAGLDDLLLRLKDGRPDVLNCSFAGRTDRAEWPEALSKRLFDLMARGTVIVAAAGNDGEAVPTYPAALPGVYAVAALDGEKLAPWSNHGDWVDLCAPGVDQVSTFYGNDGGSSTNGAGPVQPEGFVGWAMGSGTSFATPYVAGAIAATMRYLPTLSATEALALLMKQGKQVDNMVRIPPVAKTRTQTGVTRLAS